MKNMTIANMVSVVGGTYVGPDCLLEKEITGVATDSRKIEEGFLYVPFRGAKVDGHSFIPQVFEKGALITLSEEPLEQLFSTKNVMPYILVQDAPRALKELAAFYRKQLDCTIVGVTGSVGKTSTKEMISTVLSQRFCVQKTQGNFNNEVGLPLTIFSIRDEHEVAVVEMGISDFGEMSRLGAIARPDICVITNIGVAHLEMLGSRDGILKAKTEVIEYVHPQGCLILNGDDDKLSTVLQARDCGLRDVEFYGVKKDMPVAYRAWAKDLVPVGTQGVFAQYVLDEDAFEATIEIPGEHNVYNALAAALVGKRLGMSVSEIQKGICGATTIAGRNNRFEVGGVTVLDDCYNANPISMMASVDVLANASGRKIAVLGDMGELGEDEVKMHAQVGTYVAQKGIDVLYCAGTLCENMAAAALIQTGVKVHHYMNKEDLLADLMADVTPGDTVLVKASHFMAFEKIVEALRKL